MPKRKLTRIAFLLFANVSILLFLLAGTELASQLYFFGKHGHFLFEKPVVFHDQLFELHPYLAGRLKKNVSIFHEGKRISTTSFHTRWTGAANDSGRARIAVLGGSTTFGTGVSDEDSWPALLQKELGDAYAVINYGVPGYSTVEAIVQMALLVPENRPSEVLFYEGWNDIRNYHDPELGTDYYSNGMHQFSNLHIDVHPPETFMQKLAQVSALVRLVSEMKSESNQPGPVLATPDPSVDRLYVRNLKTLALLSKHIGAKALFVPQVLNEARYRGAPGSKRWTPHIQSTALPDLMRRFDALMQQACSDAGPDCRVLSEVLRQDWQPRDFVDEGHFSRVGGEKFAGLIAGVIRRDVGKK